MKTLNTIKLLWTWTFWKYTLILTVIAMMLCAVLIWRADRAAIKAAQGKLYDDVAEMPLNQEQGRVALVFGCAEKIGNRDNLYFKYRIEAAAELWNSGNIRGFIVSGDNGTDDYNEPEDMKQALIKKGVPAENIVCDYAGFRTLDSVVRLKEVFDVTEVIFVTQKFHNERAAYLAQQAGIDFIGLNAQEVSGKAAQKTNLRERLARVKMLLDCLTSKSPKFLGKKEKLGF